MRGADDAVDVAVVGVGSVGGYFAARLAGAGHRLVLCAHHPFERLTVRSGDETIEVDAPVLTDPADVDARAEVVLLATKAHQIPSAAPWLAALCGPETTVAVMQNGVEHEALVAPYARGATIVPTMVKYGGEQVAPGEVHHYTYGFLTVPDTLAGRRVASLFADTRVEVHLTDDFTTVAWRKLCTNVVANAIPAITMRRFPVFRRADIAELARGVVAECVGVGRAVGADLDESIPDDEVARLASLPDHVGSSMLYDRLAGKPLEHEALNGAVVRFGVRHGIPTPLNAALTALLAAISEGGDE